MKKRSGKSRGGEVYSFNRTILEIDLNGFTTGEADERIERALAVLHGVRGGESCMTLTCPGNRTDTTPSGGS